MAIPRYTECFSRSHC